MEKVTEKKETEVPVTKTEVKLQVRAEKVAETESPVTKEEGKLLVQDHDVVSPGEVLAEGMGFLPSDGTFRDGEKIRTVWLGLANIKGRVVKVVPLSGKYLPQPGDLVIGVVTEVRHSGWLVDINSPFVGSMSVSEAVNRFVDTSREDLSRYYDLGDTVLAQVINVSDIAHLTLRGPGLHKLRDGRIVEAKPAKVPRLIGRNGSMIQILKEGTGCNIIIGRNGRVWLKGEREKERVAIEAITTIERESHKRGLTDRIREMLKIS